MKLILMRHGKTEANEKRLYCGKTDISLSDKGKNELLQKKSEVQFPDISGMSVITSGMKRCEETLYVIYGIVPHSVDASFCEMDFGKFEMRSYDEMKNDPEYIAWISGDNEANVAPGGESGNMMKKRVLEGLQRILSSQSDTFLVTHGGVIADIMEYLFSSENKNRYEWQPQAGGGYILDITESGNSYKAF